MPIEPLCDMKHSEILRLDSLLHRKKYKLHAAFFEATMISQIDKPIQFELSIGKIKFINACIFDISPVLD
jgi:hypothetical protein